MQILNGKEMASEIIENVKDKVAKLSRPICFTDVVVGDDKASMQYALMKKKRAEAVGIKWIDAFLPGTATTEEVINKIEELNKVENIAGIIVQLSLPIGIDTQKVLNAVGPKLDVDCIG
mgnify:FL=1